MQGSDGNVCIDMIMSIATALRIELLLDINLQQRGLRE